MIVVRIGQLADQLGVHRNTIRDGFEERKLPGRSLAGKRLSKTFARLESHRAGCLRDRPGVMSA